MAVVHGCSPERPYFSFRAHQGARLYHEGKANKIITTGKEEAEHLADILWEDGVDHKDIITENNSRTTLGNLLYSMEIINSLANGRGGNIGIYLVSQEWHRPRILYQASHVLWQYPFEFSAALDPRDPKEIAKDIEQENKLLLVDRLTLPVPLIGMPVNRFAYWAAGKVSGKFD